jgi:hypothetical protein
MKNSAPNDVEWSEPWQPVDDEETALADELRRELSSNHALFGREVAAVARRIDCDDVLFLVSDPAHPLAVVHLTWKGSQEREPVWPFTRRYRSWQDWIERCLLPDHRDYRASQ